MSYYESFFIPKSTKKRENYIIDKADKYPGTDGAYKHQHLI